MKTREEVKKEYEEALDRINREERIVDLLPLVPDSLCGPEWKAPYLTYRKVSFGTYPKEEYTLSEACDAVLVRYAEHLQPVRVARAGCTSIEPYDLQRTEYQSVKATATGEVMIRLEQYSTNIIFYAKVHQQWVHVDIEITRPWRWSPNVAKEQDWRGHSNGLYVVTPKVIGENYQIKFSSGNRNTPAYHIVYLWHDLATFLNWAQEQRREDERAKERIAQTHSNLLTESN